MEDTYLITHLLGMCQAKLQTHDLTENATHICTESLLLFLENIENIAKIDAKPPSAIKSKGAKEKHKMELIHCHIPKKLEKGGWTEQHCVLCRKHEGQINKKNAQGSFGRNLELDEKLAKSA